MTGATLTTIKDPWAPATKVPRRDARNGPWSAGSKPQQPRTRVPSVETCRWCGLRYEGFRHPSVPRFDVVQEEMLAAAVARAEIGDYSKPCRLASILGRMREYKLSAWVNEHLVWCQAEHEAQEAAPF